MTDMAEIARGLTKAQRKMIQARHNEDGNPWPFISMTQRSGGSKNRTFQKMQTVGLYDRGNCLTATGLAVRDYLKEQG